jgi:hypothetical protein
MKKWLLAISFGIVILFNSCNFDVFGSNKDKDNTSDQTKYTYKWADESTKLRYECYDGDSLYWYELYSPGGDAPATKIQHYSASETLLWTYAYSYDAAGEKYLEAYYDGSDVLKNLSVYSYDASERPLTTHCYDVTVVTDPTTSGDSYSYSLKWAEYLSYTTSGKLSQKVVCGAENAVDSVVQDGYDLSDNLASEKTYGAALRLLSLSYYDGLDSSLSPKPTKTLYYTGANSSAKSLYAPPLAGATRARGLSGARSIVDLGSLPLPVIPSVPAFSLEDANAVLDHYIVWSYDRYGNFKTTLSATNYPTQVIRKDSHLDYAVTIDATWDAHNRLVSKSTHYGDTEVLTVGVTYGSDTKYKNGGWEVSSLSFSGESLLMPITVGITYDGEVPSAVTAFDTTTQTPLYTLKYNYSDTSTGVGTVIDLGPFHFGGVIASVENYSGAGGATDTYLGQFVFELSVDQKTLTIKSLKDQGDNMPDANDTDNGRFVVAYDAVGQAVSFASYNKAGGIVWQYDYDYADVEAGAKAMIGELGLTQDDVTSASTDLTKFYSDYDVNSILSGFLKQ